jgi:hypothetical protein
MKRININGKVYIPEDEVQTMAQNTDGLEYCVIRTYSAGVHAGYVAERNGKEVKLLNSRRLWKWAGAFTLSEIAVKGVSKPDECKFACELPIIFLTEAIEIIPCIETARKSIEAVNEYEP